MDDDDYHDHHCQMQRQRELTGSTPGERDVARVAYEAARNFDPRSVGHFPSWSESPGAYSTATLEYDFQMAEALLQEARAALAAAGYDPDDPRVHAVMVDAIENGAGVREAAEREQTDRGHRELIQGMGLNGSYDSELGLSRGIEDRRAWAEVYGRRGNAPTVLQRTHGMLIKARCGARSRAPRARPVRVRGSRRGQARSPGGEPPGHPEPHPLVPAALPIGGAA